MSNKHLVLILALSLVGVMGQKNATTYKPGEGDDFNVGDSRGHLISDGFGDCVKIGTWNKDHDLVDCDAAPAQAAAEPEPVPVIVAIIGNL